MEKEVQKQEFKIGDVVRLKSDTTSMSMTIEDLPTEDSALCVWRYRNKPCRETYKTAVLTHDRPLKPMTNKSY